MKEKIKILCYECKKCDRRVYFQSNEEYTTQCKICKNEMQFICENNYNPNNGLKAIKNTSRKTSNTESDTQEFTIECPYCHSKDTKKISKLSKAGSVVLFGVFALGKTSKQWHCNNCNSDF